MNFKAQKGAVVRYYGMGGSKDDTGTGVTGSR